MLRRRKIFLALGLLPLLCLFTAVVPAVDSADAAVRLSVQDVERLRVCKELLEGTDGKSFDESLREIEQSPYPRENLAIFEAVAQTYQDIVREQGVADSRKKERLYERVALNMAYLQLGGLNVNQSRDKALDLLIRRKLKSYLPNELKGQESVFHSLE